mmetsp:Transcript_16163/g.34974  ORF Transcript_16163/g.34974 Transcript_16163/m.34974 type:complete len:141 (-) Transcript_16163:51-473(-)
MHVLRAVAQMADPLPFRPARPLLSVRNSNSRSHPHHATRPLLSPPQVLKRKLPQFQVGQAIQAPLPPHLGTFLPGVCRFVQRNLTLMLGGELVDFFWRSSLPDSSCLPSSASFSVRVASGVQIDGCRCRDLSNDAYALYP